MVTPAKPITVRLLQPGDEARWDAFVEASPDATFFHLSAWKRVIERAFRHQTYYALAECGPDLVGVLPLTLVKSRLFGSSLISNAFCVYGGPVAGDAPILSALEDYAVALKDKLGVPILELRGFSESRASWPSRDDLYVTFKKAIDPVVENNLKAIPRKQRAMIRKGLQQGLVSELDDKVDRLYRIYSESVRNLGTPVFAKAYFEILFREFRERADIVTVIGDGRPVASVMNFYFRDEVLPYYGGGVAEARRLAANDFMYWEVMRRACERGFRHFDFGRSKRGTGAYDFKRYWGFEPLPLVYQFHLGSGHKIPDLNPLNPKLRLFIELWKRLPLAVAELIGPPIVRGLA